MIYLHQGLMTALEKGLLSKKPFMTSSVGEGRDNCRAHSSATRQIQKNLPKNSQGYIHVARDNLVWAKHHPLH